MKRLVHSVTYSLPVLAASLLMLAASTMAVSGPVAAQNSPALKIVAFGDSLTAGYGLPAQDAFPAKLQAALKAKGHNVEIENAGVSGDTASGGLARLDWSIPDGTDAVIVELGANDMLRGIDPAVTEANLDKIVTRLKQRGIRVLLVGMLAQPTLGNDYRKAFDAVYPRLAAKHELPLYPFFLDGVAADPKLNQGDGIHPTAEGIAVMVRGILPQVRALVEAKP